MAVNSASDRNSADEQVRTTRETYQKREAENAKKNSQQVKQLSETAQSELESIKAEHSKQMDELKSKTKDAISRRDMQYQKEISELRDMHQKQLQRVAGDAELKQTQTEKALKGEIDRTVQTTATQREELKGNYEGLLKSKDQAFGEYIEGARESQSKATDGIRDRLNKTHEKELKSVVQDRDERISDKQRELRNVRQNKDSQIKTLEHSKDNEVGRLRENNEQALRNQAADNQATHDMSREAFDQGIRQNRERYEKATERLSENAENARENLTGTVNGRMNDKIKALESENRKLKADIPRLEMKNGQQKSREMQNLRDALTANIEGLEKARTGAVAASNEKSSQDIGRANKSNTELLSRTHKFYQDKLSMEDLRNEERFATTEGDLTKSLTQEKTTAEGRIKKLRNYSEIEQGKMRSYFDRATGSMKENFETSLREVRDRNQKDQQALITQFTKQAQENDAKFQSKLTDVGVKYENQIAQTKEVHLAEIRDQQTAADRARKEIAKKADTELKAQASQYEYRIAKIEDQHARQMDQIKAQNQESLANLIKTRKT